MRVTRLPLWIFTLALLFTAKAPAVHAQDRTNVNDILSLKAGDILRIRVWPDSTLGGDFVVEETGLAYLPIMGQVRVAGRSLKDLRSELRTRYGEAFRNPVVTVTALYHVSVTGGVVRPGIVQVMPADGLYDAIDLAGGFRDDAKPQAVQIMRDGKVIAVDARVENGATAEAMVLKSGDRIVVPRKHTISAVIVLQLIAVGLSAYSLAR